MDSREVTHVYKTDYAEGLEKKFLVRNYHYKTLGRLSQKKLDASFSQTEIKRL